MAPSAWTTTNRRDDRLISLADVRTAAKRVHAERDVTHSPVVGVDPAACCRGLGNMELAARVANVTEEWTPDAVFIDAGAGAVGVSEHCGRAGADVRVPGGQAVAGGDIR